MARLHGCGSRQCLRLSLVGVAFNVVFLAEVGGLYGEVLMGDLPAEPGKRRWTLVSKTMLSAAMGAVISIPVLSTLWVEPASPPDDRGVGALSRLLEQSYQSERSILELQRTFSELADVGQSMGESAFKADIQQRLSQIEERLLAIDESLNGDVTRLLSIPVLRKDMEKHAELIEISDVRNRSDIERLYSTVNTMIGLITTALASMVVALIAFALTRKSAHRHEG